MDPEIFAVAIPIVFLMIPIVAILTNHQRKMAEIIHRDRSNSGSDEALMREIQSLRHQMNQLTLSVDSLKDEVRTSQSVQERIENRF